MLPIDCEQLACLAEYARTQRFGKVVHLNDCCCVGALHPDLAIDMIERDRIFVRVPDASVFANPLALVSDGRAKARMLRDACKPFLNRDSSRRLAAWTGLASDEYVNAHWWILLKKFLHSCDWQRH